MSTNYIPTWHVIIGQMAQIGQVFAYRVQAADPVEVALAVRERCRILNADRPQGAPEYYVVSMRRTD